MALAGGVSLMLTPELMVSLSKVGFMAPDGRCKTFDASADGFGRGEGCGVVVLKRLADAIADGDRVLAVIRGSAVNQDGHSTVLAAPNGLAQQALIAEALANAQLEPGRIGYVETHGTGTALGDPIEVEAIAATLGRPAARRGPLLARRGQGQHRPPRGGGRRDRPDQGGAGAAARGGAAAGALPPPQPAHLARRHAARRAHRAHALARRRAAALRRGELLRRGRHQRPRRSSRRRRGSPPASPRRRPTSPASCRSRPAAPRRCARWPRRWVEFLPRSDGRGGRPLLHRRRAAHAPRLPAGRGRPHEARSCAPASRTTCAGGGAQGVATGRRPEPEPPRVAFVFGGQGPQWYAMGRELLRDEPVFRDALARGATRSCARSAGWSLARGAGAPTRRARASTRPRSRSRRSSRSRSRWPRSGAPGASRRRRWSATASARSPRCTWPAC